ncbi:replication initiation protein [Thalassospira xianhensis]|uniref:Initiator Rep protein WH1 domain-containing protein n=1 Tax=Thalassospira xianhensis MCCC 1A02616 TaxID=1177929 RepID=A0A367UHX7_9PROT|nr:replication initiation protein [Thalassospira xianhensis]RCK07779.1 hypothetical protein TH5_01675 [Thalassospira xianhensis MCCC 1A02616]
MADTKPVAVSAAPQLNDASFKMAGKGFVHKAEQIVFARENGELDLVDLKIFDYLLNRVYGELKSAAEGDIHRVPVSDVLNYLRHSSSDRLLKSLHRLGTVEILINYVDEANVENEAVVHYLSYNLSKAHDGFIHFAFDPILLKFLHNPKVFATVSLLHNRKYQSKRGKRLYDIMAMFINRKYPCWQPTIEEFRTTMAVTNEYERFDNLKRRVIEASVDELNQIAPFFVTVEYVRSGRGGKISSLLFTAKPKGPSNLLEMRMVADPIGKGRKHVRDPHTVDFVDGHTDSERDYLQVSQDAMKRAVDMLPDGETVEFFLEQWSENMRGRQVGDADRSFLNWLELELAKRADSSMEIVHSDTIFSLLEQWEGSNQ